MSNAIVMMSYHVALPPDVTMGATRVTKVQYISVETNTKYMFLVVK